MSSTIALGIDLGTTNSTASIKSSGRITEISFPGEGPQLASVVYWPDGEAPLVGQKAIRAAYKQPEFLYAHFKRRMYDDAYSQVYGGHSAVELTSVLIREIIQVVCKSDPEIALYLSGQRPRDGLVIGVTHPASWGVHQTDGIREAGKLAGIEIDAFIPEPAAAAYRLLEEKQHRVSQNDLIGIIDMGGGTTDCTVHQWKQGLLNTVVGASGDGLLGGDNITGEIFKYFVQLLKLKLEDCFDPARGLNLAHPSLNTEKKRRVAIELWQAAADAKQQISTCESASVFISGPTGPEELVLTATVYDQLTATLWESYRKAIAGMLGDSKLAFSELQHLALAGGSAMARGTLQHTADVTGKQVNEILVSSSASHVVASGAAISCYTKETADAHIGRGLGLRMVASVNGSKQYTNKMLVPTNTIIKSTGEIYQDTGQKLVAKGSKTKLRLQFVEAKAAVHVPKPELGIPSLLDDPEVNRLQEVVHELTVPPGEHEVRVGFSISAGSTHYQVCFQDPTIEGVSGRLESNQDSASVPEKQEINLVVLLDISSSMGGSKIANARKAIENVVLQTVDTEVRLAIVTFGSQTGLLCPFGMAQGEILTTVANLKVGNGTPLTEAISTAAQVLRAEPTSAHKLAILVTDGFPDHGVSAEQAANDLKADTELICFGIGKGVDEGYLTRLATTQDHYFFTDDPSRIPALFDSIIELFLN